jgi:hypothetical protein
MSHGVQQYPCTICGKGGHSASRCKEIGIPPEGFYKPAPGQHQHDDDEDESLHVIHLAQLKYSYTKWLNNILKANKSRKLSLL